MGGAPMPDGGGGPGGAVMPPPPDSDTPTGVLDTGPPGGGPAGGPGAAPDISYERMGDMMPVSKVSIAEQIRLGSFDDDSIDTAIDNCRQIIADIEFRKKMRRTARDNARLRAFEVEDGNLLKQATGKVVIDRVPPAVRRRVLNQ